MAQRMENQVTKNRKHLRLAPGNAALSRSCPLCLQPELPRSGWRALVGQKSQAKERPRLRKGRSQIPAPKALLEVQVNLPRLDSGKARTTHHEPAPDINQLELRRPSDWSSVPNSSAVAPFAGRDQRERKLSEERPLISPESEKLPVPRRRSDFDTHRDRVRPEAQQSSHQRKWSLDSSHDSPLSPRTTRSVQQHEPRVYDRYIPSAPAAESNRDFSMRTRKGVADPFKNRSRVIEQVLCSISYGPKGIDVGDVRICGLSPSPKRKMMDMRKGRNILIWFQHLCTPRELEFLSKGVRIPVTRREELSQSADLP